MKQDVLSEIQRLKEEANRYLSLLSQEEENNDDQLSPAKKQSLTKEVESLQVRFFFVCYFQTWLCDLALTQEEHW